MVCVAGSITVCRSSFLARERRIHEGTFFQNTTSFFGRLVNFVYGSTRALKLWTLIERLNFTFSNYHLCAYIPFKVTNLLSPIEITLHGIVLNLRGGTHASSDQKTYCYILVSLQSFVSFLNYHTLVWSKRQGKCQRGLNSRVNTFWRGWWLGSFEVIQLYTEGGLYCWRVSENKGCARTTGQRYCFEIQQQLSVFKWRLSDFIRSKLM